MKFTHGLAATLLLFGCSEQHGQSGAEISCSTGQAGDQLCMDELGAGAFCGPANVCVPAGAPGPDAGSPDPDPDADLSDQDQDGDGFTPADGDCDDTPGDGAFIGPKAFDIPQDGIDNNCDGNIDEAQGPCTVVPGDKALALAAAMDICHEVTNASQAAIVDDRSTNVLSTFGNSYVPFTGPDLAALSTGIAGDTSDPDYDAHSTSVNTQIAHPDPLPATGCVGADPSNVFDYADVAITIEVPANAQGFTFDFNFMSTEFPEFLCSAFDDTFQVRLDSAAFSGNIAFDGAGNRISINNSEVDVCAASANAACQGETDLVGTGFEDAEAQGAGTGWLRTTAPVVPGEEIELHFMIYDEGDGIQDSMVLLDNFTWVFDPVSAPLTAAP